MNLSKFNLNELERLQVSMFLNWINKGSVVFAKIQDNHLPPCVCVFKKRQRFSEKHIKELIDYARQVLNEKMDFALINKVI